MSNKNSPHRRRRGSSLDGALATPSHGGSSNGQTFLLDASSYRHRPRRQEEGGLDHHCCGLRAGTSTVAVAVDDAATDRTIRSRRSHNHSFDGDIQTLRPQTMTSTIGGNSSPSGRSSSNQVTHRHREGRSVLMPHPRKGESTQQRRQGVEDENSATSFRSPRCPRSPRVSPGVSEKRVSSDSRERRQQQQIKSGSRGESDKHSRVLSISMRHHSDENISSRVTPGSGVRRSHRGHGEATARARLLDDRRCGGDESRLSSGRHPPKEGVRERSRSRSRSSVSSSPLSERRRRFSPYPSMKTPTIASPERIENRHRGDRIDATSRKSRDPIIAEREKLEIERGDALVSRLTRDCHYDRGHGEAYRKRRLEKDRERVVEGCERTSHRRHGHESSRSLRKHDTRNSSTCSIRRYRLSLSPDGKGLENKTRAVRHSRSEEREGSVKVRKRRQSSCEHLSMLGASKGAISSDVEGGQSFHRYIRDDRYSTPPSRSKSCSPDHVDVVEGSPVRATTSTRGRTSSTNRGDDERYWSTSGKYASSPCSSRSSRGGTGRSSGARGSPDPRRRDYLDDHRIDAHCSRSHHHRHRAGEETDNRVIGMARTRTSHERQKNPCDGEERVRISDGRCRTGGHDNDRRSKSVTKHSNSSIRRQLDDRSAGREEEDRRRRSRHSHVIEDHQGRERRASSHRHSSRTHSSDSPERRSRHHDRSSKDEYSHNSGERHRVRRPPSLIKFDREALLSMSQGAATDPARGEDGEGRHRWLHRSEKDHNDHRLRHTDVGHRSMG